MWKAAVMQYVIDLIIGKSYNIYLMQTFLLWLENTANIRISITNFAKIIHAQIEKTLISHQKSQQELKNFKWNQQLVDAGTKDYPRRQELFNSLKDEDNSFEELSQLF